MDTKDTGHCSYELWVWRVRALLVSLAPTNLRIACLPQEQFGINADDFPVFRLFPRASTVPIPFTATVTASNLLLFVKQTLGVWIGLPGCLERYDSLTDGFLSLEESQKTEKVAAAEDLLAKEVWLQDHCRTCSSLSLDGI